MTSSDKTNVHTVKLKPGLLGRAGVALFLVVVFLFFLLVFLFFLRVVFLLVVVVVPVAVDFFFTGVFLFLVVLRLEVFLRLVFLRVYFLRGVLHDALRDADVARDVDAEVVGVTSMLTSPSCSCKIRI